LILLLKSPLNQNLIMIYHKYNSNFKSHINFKGIKKKYKSNMEHYSKHYNFSEEDII